MTTKGNNIKVWKKSLVAGIILISSILIGICSLILTVLPCDLSLIQILLKDMHVLFLNIWPILCIMSIMYFMTNRVWISFLITGVLVFAIAEINRFKMTFRDSPFVFEDILLVNEAKDMMGKYSLFLDKVSLLTIIFIMLATILLFFFVKIKLERKIIRFIGVPIVALLLAVTCNFFYFKDTNIYNQTWHMEFGNQWKSSNQYMSRGVVYSFVRSIPASFMSPPEDYDKREAKTVLDHFETVDMDENKKVHIISIMLEAYNDFSEFDNIEFVEDPYSTFHEIQNNSYHGDLFTNIFAAGTIETERSFLTGCSNVEFQNKRIESYARYFNEQGYYTEAMHPCYGWFYDRKTVNEYLGFENFDCYENKYRNITDEELEKTRYHGLISDYDFFDYIIEGFEKAVKNNKKYFNFSVTYQNHGPYPDVKMTNTQYLLKKEAYTEAEYNIINNYLSGIASTDDALEKIYDYINQQSEPIVLILFGDHNPWMGENNSVYQMLEIDLDLSIAEGAANYYQTPYLFYANASAKKCLEKNFDERGNTVSPIFLMNEYFEYVGMEGSAYMNYLHSVKEKYSVINSVYVKKEDGYILRSAEEDNDILKQRECIEYYMKTKK